MKMSKSHKGALSTSKPFVQTKHMVITYLCCKTPGTFYKNKTESGVSAKSALKVIKRILAQKRSRQREKKSFFQWKNTWFFFTEKSGFKSRFINQKKRGLKAGCCFVWLNPAETTHKTAPKGAKKRSKMVQKPGRHVQQCPRELEIYLRYHQTHTIYIRMYLCKVSI